MISNFCEDQCMADSFVDFHEKELQKMGIPKWANVKCPFCDKELPLDSIRSIALKLNPRNMGDIVVEVFCRTCMKTDSVYFRKEFVNIQEFKDLLSQDLLKSNPVTEEEMYKMKYNNEVEKMLTSGVKLCL